VPESKISSDPEVDQLIEILLKSAKELLKDQWVGMYLEGSLAHHTFDRDSDIDFVVVCEEEVNASTFMALQNMHRQIATLDSWCAIQLEGSYLSRQALRQHDPELAMHPNLERGREEQLKWALHEKMWDIHRYVLREKGICLDGPEPKTLIDPISPDDLRRIMRPVLENWAAQFLDQPDRLRQRGYQSYVVLTLCRTLYTLQFGDIVSKPKALAWVKESLDARWQGLIERAWLGRQNPQLAAEGEDIRQTLAFIRYAQHNNRPTLETFQERES
jgi:predicted nucleotidyltransferase